MGYKWQRNIWTGDAILRISDTARIIRVGDTGPYYREELTSEGFKQSACFPTVKKAIAAKVQ